MGNPLQLVDIEELLRDSAERILDNELRKKADLEHPDINWDR